MKIFYAFLAFFMIYLALLSGYLVGALIIYLEKGTFVLTQKEFLEPIKPAIYLLIFRLLLTHIVPDKKDKEDKENK